MFRAPGHPTATSDQPTLGQRMAEQVAALVGSWWFLGGQALFLLLWLVYNTLQFTTRFDPPPYILLNLLLSFQAAFTGPVLLIAANVGAMRDHRQADRVEHLVAQNEQLAEQNAQLVSRILSVEQMLDEHVAQSLRAHTSELRELGVLVRAVHTAVTAGSPAAALSDPAAPEAAPAPERAERAVGAAQPSRRSAPGGGAARRGKGS
jgi:uncharacterized membrane protein